VPFTIVDNQYGLSGGQPVEVFRQAIEQAAAASVR
jgi:predicted DsbA family dithiol-disulfide isomerase